MDRLQDRFDLLPVLLLLSLLYSPDQEVLWRVFHVDEFQDLDPVPHGLEDLRAQGVCVEGGHALFDDPVAEYRGKRSLFICLLTSCWQQGTDKITFAFQRTAFSSA